MLAAGSTLLLAGCTSRMPTEELEVVASPTDVPPFRASSPTPLAPSPTHRGQPQGIASTPDGWQPPTETRITPNEAFYIMKYNPSPPPEVDLSDYRLVIEGEVDNPLTLTLDQLKAYPAITQMRTLQCIGNPIGGGLISNAVWVGISLAQLLEEAGLRPRGRFLKLESLDGYHTGIPRQLALHQDCLLAYQMNGEPLPAKHGYPIRCLFPGRYGQKQPKWLTRITAQPTHHVGHWEGQGWDDDAIIQPSSIIEQPKNNGTVKPDFVVTGIAFTNDSGLESLIVTLDNGVTWLRTRRTLGCSQPLRLDNVVAKRQRYTSGQLSNLGQSHRRHRTHPIPPPKIKRHRYSLPPWRR
jgi:DMSO/TMAO reductase YedYZ molybdopterin-dependent catalytic subunit